MKCSIGVTEESHFQWSQRFSWLLCMCLLPWFHQVPSKERGLSWGWGAPTFILLSDVLLRTNCQFHVFISAYANCIYRAHGDLMQNFSFIILWRPPPPCFKLFVSARVATAERWDSWYSVSPQVSLSVVMIQSSCRFVLIWQNLGEVGIRWCLLWCNNT